MCLVVTLRVGIVAGEASGDILGAGLMRAINRRHSDVEFVGVGGDQMLAEGLMSRVDLSRLEVNGFIDPIKRLPELARILRDLVRHFSQTRTDVVVGLDFNVFNLLLERMVKRSGIPTAHYVSPAVYAWRRNRTKKIALAADLVMVLYPFEPDFYRGSGVRAVFVGHPLADEIDLSGGSNSERALAREKLGLELDSSVIALLPGSRMSEIELLGDIFLDTASRLAQKIEDCSFVIPCVSARVREALRLKVERFDDLRVMLIERDAQIVLTASDAALVKSGTGTLETMLLRRPMVVTYRLDPITYHVVKVLKQSKFVALPNILAGRELVPELLQGDADPEKLASALLTEIHRASNDPSYFDEFERYHRMLRRDASENAAEAIFELIKVD